jgi:hypothetical protein
MHHTGRVILRWGFADILILPLEGMFSGLAIGPQRASQVTSVKLVMNCLC